MALDLCLKQLPSVLKQTESGIREPVYEPSSFFADQLTAFSVWLGENSLLTTTIERENLKQPEQLPIVLQVCYSKNFNCKNIILIYRYYLVNLIVNEHSIYLHVFLILVHGLFILHYLLVYFLMYFDYYKQQVMIYDHILFLFGQKS